MALLTFSVSEEAVENPPAASRAEFIYRSADSAGPHRRDLGKWLACRFPVHLCPLKFTCVVNKLEKFNSADQQKIHISRYWSPDETSSSS